MENDADIYGHPDGEEEIRKIQGVEKGGLKTAEKWRSGKEVGIPEGKISIAQFPEAEVAPVDELGGDIGLGGRQDL